jgi:hypothetical protein
MYAPTDGSARTTVDTFWMKPEHRDGRQNHW